MAENEGMEGKDFAKEEQVKAKFEEILTQIINEMEHDEATVTLEGEAADININVKKEKEVYNISLLGENIATIDENKEFSYNINGLENVKQKLEDKKNPVAKYEDLGLPDIEYLKELEKEKQKEDGEQEKENPDDEEKDENEKDEEEKPDLEDDKEDREEIAEEYNISSKDVIHVKRDDPDKVTEDENFASAAKFDKKYKDIYMLREKDPYTWKAIGKDKDGKKEEIENEQNKQTGGRNPDITIKKVSGEKIEEIKNAEKTIIIYEAPHKMKNTLEDLKNILIQMLQNLSQDTSLISKINSIYQEISNGTETIITADDVNDMISNLQETKVNDGDLTVTITQFNGKVNKVDITIISSSESNSFLKGLLSKEKNSDKLILKPWHIFSKVTHSRTGLPVKNVIKA